MVRVPRPATRDSVEYPPQDCLENPRDRGTWWAAVYGVAQSRTRLKWISSSSQDCKGWVRTQKEVMLCPGPYKEIRKDTGTVASLSEVSLWAPTGRTHMAQSWGPRPSPWGHRLRMQTSWRWGIEVLLGGKGKNSNWEFGWLLHLWTWPRVSLSFLFKTWSK